MGIRSCRVYLDPKGPTLLRGQGVFSLLWPLFARAPRHWFLENLLLSAPGVQSFFFCAPLGAATFRRGQSKKKQPGCFLFLLRPWAPARGQSKKKTPPRVFFVAAAPATGKGRRSPVGWAPARGFSFPCLSPGPEPKKKKKHPGWCCFFCCGPARTLTHSLRAWVAMPPPRRGGVFFFLLRPRPDRGGVFFLAAAPPGRSLTHCGLGVVFLFFAAAPPGLFRQ